MKANEKLLGIISKKNEEDTQKDIEKLKFYYERQFDQRIGVSEKKIKRKGEMQITAQYVQCTLCTQ